MADKDFTAQNSAASEQLAEQFPCNENPFGIWYDIDGDLLNRWVINDGNGDSIADVASYEVATAIADALKIRHEKINNKCLLLNAETQNVINHALLIGLDSYGEIERICDEVNKSGIAQSKEQIPDSVRPVHPTGENNTIGIFVIALRYMQQV